jgi:outer membrane protein assembly factor BamB
MKDCGHACKLLAPPHFMRTSQLPRVVLICLFAALSTPFAQQADKADRVPAAKVETVPTQASAWQLAWTDLDRDGRDEIVYASYRGLLTCQEVQSGRVKWSFDLGGLPFAIRTRDINGDGFQEVIVASSSLSVVALNANGKLLWRHTGTAPLYSVAAGRLLDPRQVHVAVGGEDLKATLLDKDGRVVKQITYLDAGSYRSSARAMDAGDTNGDGLDELLVVNANNRFTLLDPRSGKVVWNQQGSNWGRMFEGKLLDLDGSGRCKAYAASRKSVFAVDGTGQLLWEKRLAPGSMGCEQIALAPADLDGDGKLELAAQLGSKVFALDAAGNVRFTGDASYFYFNGIAASPKPASRQVMLASVTGADRNVYRVTFGAGAKNELDAFPEPPGYRAEIARNLGAIREQVRKLPVDRQTPRRAFTFSTSGGQPTREQLRGEGKRRDRYRALYPNGEIIYYTNLGLQETGYETTQAATYPVAELMKFAEAAEESKAYHMLITGHGTDPSMSPATLDEWLKRTPTTCLGIVFSELNVAIYQLPEYARSKPKFDEFIERSFLPLIDTAAKHGKRTHMMMKMNWWATVPALRDLGQKLFSPERRKWIVPAVEESAATTPEINLMGMVGLWRSGLVESWEANIIHDQLVINSHLVEWNPSDPHHLLRHLVASAAAGATHFKGLLHDFTMDRARKYDLPDNPLRYTPFGQLSQDIFLTLLDKGILDVPTPENIVGLSPVAFRFEDPSQAFLKCEHESVSQVPAQIPAASANGLFSGTEWAFTRTRDTFAPRYLLGVDRYGHAFMPTTPYGLPTLVPAWFSSPRCNYIQQQWHTDGIDVLVNGARRTAAEMKPAIAASFAQAAARLPVRATNCYWMGTRRSDGTIRVTLVDSPYVDPVGAEADLVTLTPIVSLRDVIANQPLPFTGRTAKLKIPAGAFRIVDVKTTNAGLR